MASVYRQRGALWAKWKDGAGKWRYTRLSVHNKTAANRMARDLEAQGERQRLGLDPLLPSDGGGTVEALLTWWLETYRKGTPSEAGERSAVKKHIVPALGSMTVATVRPHHVRAFLEAKRAEGLAPQSRNHLRGHLARAFQRAVEAGRWPGANPLREVKTYRVPKGVAEYLTEDEVRGLLAHVSDARLNLVAVAVHTGLRKGELAGLRKRDVFLDDGNPRLHVSRSWDRTTTKSGKGRVVPVGAECVPYLRAALDASPADSELVFPGPTGGLMCRSTDLVRVVKLALANAGVVEGYTHVCRARVNAAGQRDRTAPRCEHSEEAKDNALRRCPVHGDKLWPKARVRAVRFHHLRHTTASLLSHRGASLADIGALLGHSNVTVTERYAHMSPQHLRSMVESLRFGTAPDALPVAPAVEPARVAASGSDVAGVALVLRSLTTGQDGEAVPSARQRKRPGVTGPWVLGGLERETGFEPATLSLGS